MIPSTLIELVVQQAIQVSLVAVLVAILVRFFARNRPHLAHALWTLVLVKCLIPPVFALPTSPFSWLGNGMYPSEGVSVATSAQASEEVVVLRTPRVFERPRAEFYWTPKPTSFASEGTPATKPSPAGLHPEINAAAGPAPSLRSWTSWLLLGWLVSSVLSLGFVAWRLSRFLKKVRTAALDPADKLVAGLSEQVQNIALKIGLRHHRARRVRVGIVDSHIGPAVVGLRI